MVGLPFGRHVIGWLKRHSVKYTQLPEGDNRRRVVVMPLGVDYDSVQRSRNLRRILTRTSLATRLVIVVVVLIFLTTLSAGVPAFLLTRS